MRLPAAGTTPRHAARLALLIAAKVPKTAYVAQSSCLDPSHRKRCYRLALITAEPSLPQAGGNACATGIRRLRSGEAGHTLRVLLAYAT